MCLEDIRIMRRSTSGQETRLISATASVFIPENPHRISLVIGSPETNEVVISLSPAPTATTGIRLQAGTNPVILNLTSHGDMVTKAFYAIAVANTEYMTYFESSFVDTEK